MPVQTDSGSCVPLDTETESGRSDGSEITPILDHNIPVDDALGSIMDYLEGAPCPPILRPGNGLSESLVPELPASTPVDFPDTSPRSPAKALHADFNIKLALYPLQKAIWCKKSRLWKSLEPDLLKGSSPIAHSHLDKLPVTPRPIAGNITFHPQEGCVDGRDVSDQDTKVRIFPPEKHKHGVLQKQPVIPNIKVEEVFKRTKQQVLHLSIVSILQLGTVAEARNPDTNVGTNSQDEDDEGNNNRKRKRFKSPDPGRAKQQFACLYHMRHFSRTHGEYVCSECYRTFENSQLRQDLAQSRYEASLLLGGDMGFYVAGKIQRGAPTQIPILGAIVSTLVTSIEYFC
ncbi:hypothetical protein GX48_07647 [Paracoccidioides brasiliensis]|nr:hypothetical protein GX48_07647 [Paracoccidioides brasiliensis]